MRDSTSRLSFAPVIYVANGRAFKLPILLEQPNRGLTGPFDATKIGQPREKPDTVFHDDALKKLLPGCLLVFYDQQTANQVGASDNSFVGIVSSVNRTDGVWEVQFEGKALWFRKEGEWRKLGQPHKNRWSYHPYEWVLPESQRAFFGFRAMRFRSLQLPDHPGAGLFVPQYTLTRDAAGNPSSFEGEMWIEATLPANNVLTQDGESPAARRTNITLYACDTQSMDVSRFLSTIRVPEEILRRIY